tara:strand:+ start:4263 stop:5027 length:765 start_codon:yes stop_codon:yes gene_type:complete
MDYLKNLNPHKRDNDIELEEETHIYTINNKSDYTSVTTWNHSHFPKFNSDNIISLMMKGKNWKNNKYYGKTKEEIKNIWEINKNEAAEAGTKMHLDIEKFYNNINVDNKSVEYQQFLKYQEDNKDLKPYRTEWMIYDEEHKLAGSIDMIYENTDGTLEIRDWKRSKQIIRNKQYEDYARTKCISHVPNLNFWHYALQLNTYKSIIERKYNKKVGKLYLVVFHPTQTNYKLIEIPEMDDEIRELLKNRKIQIEKT